MMRKLVVLFLTIVLILIGCSGDKQDDSGKQQEASKSVDSTTWVDESSDLDMTGFDIDVYLDTVTSETGRVAGQYLKLTILDGKYVDAINLSCQNNLEVAKKDSMAQYVLYGKDNPVWDKQTAFLYYLTRNYIPVVAKFNKIYYIRKLHCDKDCLYEYKIGGPRFFKRMFKNALGEDDFDKFYSLSQDVSVPIEERKAFYDNAYEKIVNSIDTIDVVRIAEYDTLRLIQEDGQWKVCKDAKDVQEMFKQN